MADPAENFPRDILRNCPVLREAGEVLNAARVMREQNAEKILEAIAVRFGARGWYAAQEFVREVLVQCQADL